MSVLGRRYRN